MDYPRHNEKEYSSTDRGDAQYAVIIFALRRNVILLNNAILNFNITIPI
jgi:hypothetical protein